MDLLLFKPLYSMLLETDVILVHFGFQTKFACLCCILLPKKQAVVLITQQFW